MRRFFKRLFSFSRKAKIILCIVSLFMLNGCMLNSLVPSDLQKQFVVSYASCWPCSAYSFVWDAIGNAAHSSFPSTCAAALSLLGVGLMFWTGITVLKFISSVKEPNLKDFIPLISGVWFKALVVAVFLSSAGFAFQLLDMFISPILISFVQLSRSILFASDSIATGFLAPITDLTTSLVSGTSLKLTNALLGTGFENYPIFTKSIGKDIQDLVYRLYVSFSQGMMLGFRMMLMPGLVSQCMGLFVAFVFFAFMMLYPFIFLETFIALGVVIVIFPILLVGWVFPSTKNYIVEGLKILFQCMAQMLITCIYLGVMVAVLKNYTDQFTITQMLHDPSLIKGITNMSDNSLGFFALVYCMFKLTNDIPNIASYMVGEINRSVFLADMQKYAKLATGALKVAIGGVLVGTGVGAAAGKSLMKSGMSTSTDAMRDIWKNDGADSQDTSIRDQMLLNQGRK